MSVELDHHFTMLVDHFRQVQNKFLCSLRLRLNKVEFEVFFHISFLCMTRGLRTHIPWRLAEDISQCPNM